MKKSLLVIIVISVFTTFFGCTVREVDFIKEDMGFIDNRTGTVPETGLYLAPVKFAGYWGFIDQHGSFTIEPSFKNAMSFSDGLALVLGEDGWGFIDKTGNYKIGPGLSAALPFSEGLAAVREGSLWGYIDTEGNEVIQPSFYSAESFNEGYAVVSSNNIKKGYIDASGSYIIHEIFDIAMSFSEGKAFVYPYHDGPDPNMKSAYINTDGTLFLQPQLSGYNFGSFSEDLAPVYRQFDLKYGYMNTSGKIVIEPRFLIALPFTEGLAAAKEFGTFGYIDKTGKYVINAEYDNAQPFKNDIAAVAYYTKQCGFIDISGNLIIDYDFQDTRPYTRID